MTGRWLAVVLVLAYSVGGPAHVRAQDAEERQTANTLRATAGAAGPKASLADVRGLVGRWTGTGLGGVSEEVWSDSAGGAMMGMYRLVTGGAVTFYEFMNMVEENGTLTLRLKHFNRDMTAWEEKDRFVSFHLVRVTPTEAYFGGLTFRRVGDDRLLIYLSLRDANGTVREEEFRLERQP